VARGLEEMHQNGWHHGDIKLENVMVNYYKEDPKAVQACLGDFDFARKISKAPFLYRGSPAYIDPRVYWQRLTGEQLFEADVFSLGVLFAELWLEIEDVTNFPWLLDTVLETLSAPPKDKPEKFERSMMEELGFIKEPEDKLSIEHMIWRMCSPIGEERPKIGDVVDTLARNYKE
jgi:serine/threonine protein kinase